MEIVFKKVSKAHPDWDYCSDNCWRELFLSPFTIDARADTILKYEIGVWTYPIIPHSKLFAYDNLKNATYWGGETILKCEAEGVTHPKFRTTDRSMKNMRLFWKLLKERKRVPDEMKVRITKDFDFGTVFCESLRPIEEIRVSD